MNVTAKVRRSGDWWAIEVPEVVGVFSQAKRLDKVAAMAADAVGVMLDVDPATVAVVVDVDVPEDIATQLEQLAGMDAELATQRAKTQAFRRALIARLRESERLTVRDVAELVHISPQRVSQLMSRGPRSDA